MGKIQSKSLLIFSVILFIGLSLFIPKPVYALNNYAFGKKPKEVLPLFINEAPIKYNLYGLECFNNIKTIDLSNSYIDSDLEDKISLFNNVNYIDLRNHDLSYEQMISLKERFPHITFNFSIKIGDILYDSFIEELDLNHINITDLEDFKHRLSLFTHLKKLDMSYCNLTNEQLGALREEFPNVQIDWVVHLSKWSFRTDVKSFSVLVVYINYVPIKSEDLEVLKYCWNMEALDLGHQAITDVTPIAKYLPNLKILILADNKISDISPLASLTKLHYLELFINPIHDISALSNLKELVDLNLCYDRIWDYSPLYDLPMLERLWLVGTGVNGYYINQLKNYHPDTQIVYTGAGSTESGYRKHERYYEMIKMFKDRYYMSPSFTKYDQDYIEKHNYLNEEVEVVIDNKLGTSKNNIIYLTNYGHLKTDKKMKVHVLGEYKEINNYKGKVIAIIRRNNEDVLVVSNSNYSEDAIKALVEYKENTSKYQLIK